MTTRIAFAVLTGSVFLLGLGFLLLAYEVAGLRREVAETQRKLGLARLKAVDLYPKGPNEI